ncbi:MAG TPA: rhomboid family intramembrane serine protease [Roseiflexaceae bacterium]|nr:rhomboid family intramembrane serine protease [Roseiflexaceae bacterium]
MTVIPVASEQRTKWLPLANLTIIGLNFLMFLLEISLGDTFIETWAFTPAHFTAFLNGSGSFQAVLTIFTSMFMHAGWSHLFGNMLFLWIFGQATESAFGSRMYTIFYLVCGVAANMAQYLVDPNSTVLNLGASGAIAGVMGGYLAMYPTSTIDLFVWPLSLFTGRDLRVPAWLMLGLWFAVQVILGVNGMAEVGAASGVAYWAHIGGFITGLVLALVVRPGVRDSLSTA